MTESRGYLQALVSANERMIELFRWLDSEPHVAHATRGMDARQQTDAIIIEQFVEGTFHGGGGICFWLESRVEDGRPRLEASVFLQFNDGQSTIREEHLDPEGEEGFCRAIVQLADSLWQSRAQDFNAALAVARTG